MRSHLILLAVCFSVVSKGQDQLKYQQYISEAWNFYEQKDFASSAAAYSMAFGSMEGTVDDKYNAACMYSLANVPDSAFYHLRGIAEQMDYANVDHITTDSDLAELHADGRWETLIAIIQKNKDRREANYDKPLVALLDSIDREDQELREQSGEVEAKYGSGSDEINALWDQIEAKDSSNQLVITNLLDTRGWLGADVIGNEGNSTLFLVIQHADLATQEKYLPMMRDAVAKGKAKGSSLAMLEDRILIKNGKRQLYGSQIGVDQVSGAYYLSPLEDPDHVDERRAEVGLGPIADYIAQWHIEWDVEAYKKALPAIEEKLKAH